MHSKIIILEERNATKFSVTLDLLLLFSDSKPARFYHSILESRWLSVLLNFHTRPLADSHRWVPHFIQPSMDVNCWPSSVQLSILQKAACGTVTLSSICENRERDRFL